MKPGAPWSIKGIDPEAREAAKNAAAQVGMTLGEFFNHILLETDPTEIVRGNQVSAASSSKRMSATAVEPDIAGSAQAAGDMVELRQSVSLMAEQITSLQEGGEETPGLSQQALEDINYRIEESRQQGENAIAETQSTLAGISERIEASISRSNEAITTVGKAIEVMAGRIDTLEKQTGNAAMAVPVASEPLSPKDMPEDPTEQSLEDTLEELQPATLASSLDDYSPAKSDDWLDKIVGDDDAGNLLDAERPEEIPEESTEESPDQSDDVTPPDSSVDSLSKFDVDAYLAEKAEQIEPGIGSAQNQDAETPESDMPESAVSETANLEDRDIESAGPGEDDLTTDVTALAPPSDGSVDDFLNQFGDDMLISAQDDIQEDVPSETAPLRDDDAGDIAAPDEPVESTLIEPEYESEEPVQSPGKSPQDVIEAIRRAARQSSMPEAFAEDGENMSREDEAEEDGRLNMARVRRQQEDRSSGVKYVIYAACTAILLAAGGWIASMKGLI